MYIQSFAKANRFVVSYAAAYPIFIENTVCDQALTKKPTSMTSILHRRMNSILMLFLVLFTFQVSGQISNTHIAPNAMRNAQKDAFIADPLYGGGIAANSYCVFPGNPPAATFESAASSDGVQPYTYQWQMWNATLGVWTVIPGQTATTIQPAIITETTKFRRKTTDKVLEIAFSNEITYTLVNTPLTPGAITYSGANPFCAGSTPPTITSAVDAFSNLGNLSYVWEFKTDSNPVWAEIANTNSNSYSPAPIYEKTYFRRVAVDQCGLDKRYEPTGEIIFDVHPLLIPTTLAPGFPVIFGAAPPPIAAMDFVNGFGTKTYQWQSGASATGPWTDISGETALNFQPPALTNTSHFRLKGTDACNTVYTNVVTYTVVAPLYPGNITTTSTCVPSGSQPASIFENAAASDGAQPYVHAWEFWNATLGTWTVIPGETGTSLTPPAITETTKYRRKTTDSNLQSAYSNEVTITVNAAVVAGVITPANQTVGLNIAPAPFTLSTLFSGGTGSFTYQWQSGPSASGPWTDISGETGTSYQPSASPSDLVVYYRVLATDAGCNGTSPSNSVKLTVTSIAPLYPGNIITSSSCVPSGSQPAIITENAAASDGLQPYIHAWEFWNATLNVWTEIPGETGTSLIPPAITETTKYRRKTTDSNASSAYSNEVTITVNPAVVPGVITPSSMVVAANIGPSSPFELTTLFTGGTGSFTYQWQTAATAMGPWTDIPGETGTTYLSPGANNDTTIYYRIVATDVLCSGIAYSNTIFIDVNAAAALFGGAITTTLTCVPFGNPTSAITENASSSDGIQPYIHFWQYWNATVGAWVVIPGATATTLPPQTIAENTTFRRGTIDQNTDTAYTNEIVFLYQASTLMGGTIVNSTSLCGTSGFTPGVLNSSAAATGGTGLFAYQWEVSINGGPWNNIAGATNETYTPTSSITQPVDYRRKVTDNCGIEYSNVISFTVGTPTDPGEISLGSTAICSPISINLSNLTLATGSGPVTYQWQRKVKGGNWVNVSGQTLPDFGPSSATQTTEYRRGAIAGCGDTTFSNVVTVYFNTGFNSYGIIYPTTPVICAGNAPGAILSAWEECSKTGPVSYHWEMFDAGAGIYSTIPGANGPSLSNPPTFTSGGYGATYFRIATDVCGSAVATPPVNIFDYPINNSPAPVYPDYQAFCLSANATPEKFVLQGDCFASNGQVTYQWQSASSAMGPWTDISGATSDEYQSGALSQTTYFRVRMLVGPCAKEVFSLTTIVDINTGCRTANGKPIVDKDVKQAIIKKANQPVMEQKAAPKAGDLMIFPNPAKTNSEVTIMVATNGKASLTMQTIDGKQIPVRATNLGTNMMKVKLPNTVAPGIYLIQVMDSNKSWIEKLVIN